MLVIVAPGQGAQKPGFLAPWLHDPSLVELLGHFCEFAELDLTFYGTQADEDQMRDTAITQPLLVAASLLSYAALGNPRPDLTAGHSVGEYAAAAIAGFFGPQEALTLVRERGRAMASASAATPTSMMAVVGGKESDVLAAIEAAGATVANHNGRGQIVAAGSMSALTELAEHPPVRARIVPLSVAGAFHTAYMEPAVAQLRHAASGISVQDASVRFISNRDGKIVTDRTQIIARLVDQVSAPVRWDLCMQQFIELGVSGMLELLPGGTLCGIAKRNLPEIERFALSDPDQLDEARAFVTTHGDHG